MKLDFGQVVSTLANIGVIAGIIFLGVELHQNNELMEIEAERASGEQFLDIIRTVYEVPGFAELLTRKANGETLTEADESKIVAYNITRIEGIQRVYDSYSRGDIAFEDLPVNGWRVQFFGVQGFFLPPLIDTWETISTSVGQPPDFVQFMEENVLHERE